MGDDVVGNFMAITGATESVALQYLSTSDFDLNQGVALYFAANDGVAESSAEGFHASDASQPQPSASSSRQQFAGRLVDYDDEESNDVRSAEHVMQEFMRFGQHIGMPSAFTSAVQASGNVGMFGGQSSRVEELSDTDESVSSSRTVTDQLFAPPSYTFSGDFTACCQTAVERQRWVILNVLRKGGFQSGCLNRDVWKDSLVSDILPQMCFLFQVIDKTPAGRLIEERYHLSQSYPRDAPLIFIVNPLTKAIMQRIPIRINSDGTMNSSSFLEDLTGFIEHNPPEFSSSSFAENSATQPPPSSSQHQPFTVDDEADDEDHMLAIALAESRRMAEESQQRLGMDEPALSPPSEEQHVADDTDDHCEPLPAPQLPVDISAYTDSLTSASPSTTLFKLRIRMPAGPMELSVSGNIPVSLLAEYLAFRVQESNPAAYATRPAIEIRIGFPPKACVIPSDASVTLSEWGAVKPSDSLLVHIV